MIYGYRMGQSEWADVVCTVCDMRNKGKWYWQHNQYGTDSDNSVGCRAEGEVPVLPCAS